MAVQVLTALGTYIRPLSANWMRVSPVSVSSCVKPTVGTSPGAVGAVGSSGGGAVIPLVDISPAKAEIARVEVSAIAIKNRFII